MINALFTIVKTKSLEIPFEFQDIRNFPVHEWHAKEAQEIKIMFSFKPTLKLDNTAYLNHIGQYFSAKYRAHSVTYEIVEFQKKIL